MFSPLRAILHVRIFMQRRAFMKGCVALGASSVILPQVSILEASETKGKTRIFYVKNSYNLKHENKNGLTKLWVPLPQETLFQKVSDFKFSSNATNAYVTDKNSYYTTPKCQDNFLKNLIL